MRKGSFIIAAAGLMILLSSCGGGSETRVINTVAGNNKHKIKQLPDGTISLNVEKAHCYSDMNDPSGNTAEWSVVASKSGRYDVWISSATKDTTDLKYKNKVLVSVQDTRIEAKPSCDKIIQDAQDVNYPYFRADSFLGSMYIQDTGLFNVQIISEKILPKDYNIESEADIAKLLSVSFTPKLR